MTSRPEPSRPDKSSRWPSNSLGKCIRSRCRLPRSSLSTRSTTFHPGRCASPRTQLLGFGFLHVLSSKFPRAHTRTRPLRSTRGCRHMWSCSRRAGGSSTPSTGSLSLLHRRLAIRSGTAATRTGDTITTQTAPDLPCPRTCSTHAAAIDSTHMPTRMPPRPSVHAPPAPAPPAPCPGVRSPGQQWH